jgi:hypothetical protein
MQILSAQKLAIWSATAECEEHDISAHLIGVSGVDST